MKHKLLVVIANYGTKNDSYLTRVLAEYRTMPYQIDLVVTSNLHKDFGKDVEVVIGLPSKNPHSLPFAHRQVFADRRDAYDLYIYTEDDILITERNIESFLAAAKILPLRETAGFFRWEQYPNGTVFYPDVHSHFRWMPGSVKVIGNSTFAQFSNEHSGCYALTREQLAAAITSGGFLVEPHEFQYGMLESAATDVFTQCGFKKLLCLSHWNDFLVPHLPNKYLGSRLGLDAPDLDRQIQALLHHSPNRDSNASLLEHQTRAFYREWSKDYYEPCREDLLSHFSSSTRAVLSIGCGWGETESALVRKGIDVTAIPLDSVIATCAEFRGIKIVTGSLNAAMQRLRGKLFDGVLLTGILHLLTDPGQMMRDASSLLNEGGVLVATVPAFNSVPDLWYRMKHHSNFRGWRDFQRSGVRALNIRQVKKLIRNAGLSVEYIPGATRRRWEALAASTGKTGRALFASEYTFVGRQMAPSRKGSLQSDSQQAAEGERTVPELQVGGSGR